MGIFNIKITPREIVREWDVKYLRSSRIKKICEYCRQAIDSNADNTSFMKRTTQGFTTQYYTIYAHGHKDSVCTQGVARVLNIDLTKY